MQQNYVSNTTLREIAWAFLKMGATSFGGPAVHIAMMEEQLVRKRQWLSREELLDLVGAANLIPGPNSTEVAIHIGYKMGGWRGLLTAGICFIAPAFLIVWLLAWFYMKYGSLPAFQSIFFGMKPVIFAIIIQAIWNLSKTAIKDKILAALSVLALLMFLSGKNEILILLVTAILNLMIRQKTSLRHSKLLWVLAPALMAASASKIMAQTNGQIKVPLENLFLFFAKIGSVLFGSGYVLIAFLQSDLVERYHWITNEQLLDAITVGQFTPGPVFTTATFIGYLISGHLGAIAATFGIFLPAFFFVAVTAPFIPAMRKWPWMAAILDGLNIASVSLMAGTAIILAKSTIFSIHGTILGVASVILLTRFKINSVWLLLVGGFLGLIIS